MGLPLITLQPGGSRPPSPTQKTNILAALGAAALGHGHAIADIVGLVTALGGKLGIHKATSAPLDTALLWFHTGTYTLAVHHAGVWCALTGTGTGTSIAISETPPENTTTLWFDPADGSLSVYYVDAWVQISGGGPTPAPAALTAAVVPNHYATFCFDSGDYGDRQLACVGTAADRKYYADGTLEVVWNGAAWRLLDDGAVIYTATGDTTYPEDALWLGGSVQVANRPPLGAVGQTLVVNHSDVPNHTEWGCVSLTPLTWLPRSSGLLFDGDNSQWLYTSFAGGTIQSEILPDQ